MSIESISSQIAIIDREINNLEREIQNLDADISRKSKDAATITERISREKDLNDLHLYQKI
jgi:archaellum component FlaC